MRRLVALCLLTIPSLAWGQRLELQPEQLKANVGDIITFRITATLHPGQELLDLAPRMLLSPPEGMRIISTDTLRSAGGDEYGGKVRMAFYRIGRQPVPTLALLYRPAPGASPDTLVHAPLSIEIEPILPAGNPEIKDIRPLRMLGGPVWGPLLILLAVVAAGFFWLSRRNRSRAHPKIEKLAPIPTGPFDVALARLAELEARSIASGNGIVPLFGEVADLVRGTLVQVGALPHQGLTTPEVPPQLPSRLASGDLAQRCASVLGDADLVKFAKVKPDRAAATSHVSRARGLFEAWRDAAGGA